MPKINSCRVCKNKELKPFFDLGCQPLANSLLKDLDKKEKFYPLSLVWCPKCSLVQLSYTVSPKKLFSEYVWVTGTSKTARDFSETFYKELSVRSLKKGYVLEIASNDGTFLHPFIRGGYEVLGIDPARNIVEMAGKKGIPTKCLFFGAKSAERLVKEKGLAQIVFARNVLPHIASVRDFVKGLEICLAKEGTLAIEMHYAKKILEQLHYDSIYHEHLCYFTLKSLEKLLNDFNLYVFDIIESPISGGSIIVYAKKNRTKEKPVVQLYRNREKADRVNIFQSWKNFAKRADSHRQELINILSNISEKNENIVGYGASARSSTLLNFCGIDSKYLPLIADQNPLKHNLFTAGTHIAIKDPKEVLSEKPKYILILAWNFAKEITKILTDKFNYQGKVIIPLPEKVSIKKV